MASDDRVTHFVVNVPHNLRHLDARHVMLVDATRDGAAPNGLAASVCERYARNLTGKKTVTIDATNASALVDLATLSPGSKAIMMRLPTGYTKLTPKAFKLYRLLISAVMDEDHRVTALYCDALLNELAAAAQ